MRKLAIVAVCLLALTSVSRAADFSKSLLSADGKPICGVEQPEGKECPDGKTITLGQVVRGALYASFPDEQNLSLDEKVRRGDLAFAIRNGGDVPLKAEDIALMKRLVGKAYGPLIVWAAVRELDPPK